MRGVEEGVRFSVNMERTEQAQRLREKEKPWP